MSIFARISVGVLVVASLVPLSCRTYGGHGSEEASLQQIEAAVEQFSRDLSQAQNDLRLINAAQSPQQNALAAHFARTVEAHERLAERHKQMLEDAQQNAGSYRHVSRTLRGMITEQETIYNSYLRVINAMRTQQDSTYAARSGSVISRPHVVPPYYERMQNASYARPIGGVSRLAEDGAAATSSTTTPTADPSAAASTDTVAAEAEASVSE